MKDKRVRSIVKTVSWRAVGTVTTSLIVFAFIREWKMALFVGGIETTLKLLLFYLHERGWEKIKWGRH